MNLVYIGLFGSKVDVVGYFFANRSEKVVGDEVVDDRMFVPWKRQLQQTIQMLSWSIRFRVLVRGAVVLDYLLLEQVIAETAANVCIFLCRLFGAAIR